MLSHFHLLVLMTIKYFGVKSMFSFLPGVSHPSVLIQGRLVSLHFAKADKLKHVHPVFTSILSAPISTWTYYFWEWVICGLPMTDKVYHCLLSSIINCDHYWTFLFQSIPGLHLPFATYLVPHAFWGPPSHVHTTLWIFSAISSWQ